MSGEVLIRIADLRFAYGARSFALEVPRLEIERGARLACIGPSGSGKTTLVNLIAGILTPDAGSVRFGADEVSRLADAERRALRISRIGMVFQEFELLEYLTALENVLLPYHVAPALELTREVEARARELARSLGIGHTLGRRPGRLSQGERQRIALCRALIGGPELVVADEPTGNLDPDNARALLDLLFEQTAARGATLLVVTHDHSLLGRFDRVIEMGELVRRGAS